MRDEVVYERREGIIQGELAGGQRLVERDLAASLQVSRVTIREALQQLSAEGLVMLLPRRGAQVTIVDEASLTDMEEVRASLEVLAARSAAKRRDDEGLKRLHACLARADKALAAGDRRGAVGANVAFHEEIVRCASNDLLSSIAGNLHGRILRLFMMTRKLDTDAMGDHSAMVAALESRDVNKAEELALEHVLSTSRATRQAMADAVAEPAVSNPIDR